MMLKRMLMVVCVAACGACGGEASGPEKLPSAGDPGGQVIVGDPNEPGDPNHASDPGLPPSDPGQASDPDSAGDEAVPGDPTEPGDPNEPPAGIEINQGWIGGACSSVAQCDNPDIETSTPDSTGWNPPQCLTAGFPNGFCTAACKPPTSGGTRYFCPDTTYNGTLNTMSRCIDANGTPLCATECDPNKSPTGCRPGYACVLRQRYNEADKIYPVCLPSDILRWPGEAAPAFDIGDACISDMACEHLKCLTPEPNGFCTKTMCNFSGCPTGSHCFEEPADSGTFVCLKDCTDSGDCRTGEGYTCDGTDNFCWVP